MFRNQQFGTEKYFKKMRKIINNIQTNFNLFFLKENNFQKRYVDELVFLREKIREKKNWKFADVIRKYLDEKGTFVFDTKDGSVTNHVPEKYFENKPQGITKRQFFEKKLQEELKAERMFDAWLYSTLQSGKKKKSNK